MHLEHEPSDEMDLLISAINEADLGWKADVCKYQKHHDLYGDHCDKQTVTLAQTSSSDDDIDDLLQQMQQLVGKPQKEFGKEGDKDF